MGGKYKGKGNINDSLIPPWLKLGLVGAWLGWGRDRLNNRGGGDIPPSPPQSKLYAHQAAKIMNKYFILLLKVCACICIRGSFK